MSAAGVAGTLQELLPGVWTFALRISRDPRDAEDLVHRAYLRALERMDELKPETAPLNWMFSIVCSLWFNDVRVRSGRHRTSQEWNERFIKAIAGPAAHPPASDVTKRRIVAAVEQLPDAQRVVMLLVAVEGLSYDETANVLDVPVETVMHRLSRARRTVGAQLFFTRKATAAKDGGEMTRSGCCPGSTDAAS